VGDEKARIHLGIDGVLVYVAPFICCLVQSYRIYCSSFSFVAVGIVDVVTKLTQYYIISYCMYITIVNTTINDGAHSFHRQLVQFLDSLRDTFHVNHAQA
jgi:hypothetical protein